MLNAHFKCFSCWRIRYRRMAMPLNRIKYPLRSITTLSSLSHPLMSPSFRSMLMICIQRPFVNFSLVTELMLDIFIFCFYAALCLICIVGHRSFICLSKPFATFIHLSRWPCLHFSAHKFLITFPIYTYIYIDFDDTNLPHPIFQSNIM